MIVTEFGDTIAERIRAEHVGLAARWLERLEVLIPVKPADVFPSSTLLDHIPALIAKIADYLRAPETDAIAANTAVIEKARQLGALRHDQRASLHQILREYQLLGSVLVVFVQEETTRLGLAPAAIDCMSVVSRLHQAVDVLMQETVETFVGLYTNTITDQAERLKQFARMATHEWRQPLGVLQFAVSTLQQDAPGSERAQRAFDVIQRNVIHLAQLTRQIEVVARLSDATDSLVIQDVSLTTIVNEAARQLREMAQANAVSVRIADDLPSIVVDVGRVELALVNLLSNGIKYADRQKAERFVDVAGAASDNGYVELQVRDNGIGIPAPQIDRIFDRFARIHAHLDQDLNISGVGLGLSIVADCLESIGGTIAVSSEEGAGTTFTLRLPCQPAAPGASDVVTPRGSAD